MSISMGIRTNIGSVLRVAASRTTVLLVAGMLLASLVGAAAVVADSGEPTDELIVEPSPDGSVEMTLVLTYDLSEDSDADGFNSIAEDESAQEELRERYEDRMQTVAADTDDRLDRDVTVSGADIHLHTDEAANIGTVTLSITWEQLAAVEEGTLVITEPFASGFEAEQRVTAIAPDGYVFSTVEPSPTESAEAEISWATGTDLDGFEVVMDDMDADPADDGDDAEALPGFGLLLGIVGILVAIGVYQLRDR